MLFDGKLRVLNENDPNPYPDSVLIDCSETEEDEGEAFITAPTKRKKKTAIQLAVETLKKA